MRKSVALAAMTAALLTMPAAAQARVIRAETVLPPGQSGFVPESGTNPHLTDQLALFQSFAFKPAGFDLPGTAETPFAGVTITRDAYGVPERPRGQRPRPVEGRRLRRGAGPPRAARAVPPRDRRAGSPRCSATSRLESDIVARRDYYTPARAAADAQPPAGVAARALRRLRRRASTPGSRKVAADPSHAAARVRALEPHPGAVAAGRLRVDRRPARAHDPERRRRRARQLGGAAQARRRSASRSSCRCAARGQVATVPGVGGPLPVARPAARARTSGIGYKRSRKFLQAAARRRRPRPTASAALLRGGSDAWAIRGSGSRSWLFHGPQLGFEIPEQLAELEVHRPGLDARGVTPPGLPLVGIGRNDHIAWGADQRPRDDDDLYVERLAGKERYRFKGRVAQDELPHRDVQGLRASRA